MREYVPRFLIGSWAFSGFVVSANGRGGGGTNTVPGGEFFVWVSLIKACPSGRAKQTSREARNLVGEILSDSRGRHTGRTYWVLSQRDRTGTPKRATGCADNEMKRSPRIGPDSKAPAVPARGPFLTTVRPCAQAGISRVLKVSGRMPSGKNTSRTVRASSTCTNSLAAPGKYASVVSTMAKSSPS